MRGVGKNGGTTIMQRSSWNQGTFPRSTQAPPVVFTSLSAGPVRLTGPAGLDGESLHTGAHPNARWSALPMRVTLLLFFVLLALILPACGGGSTAPSDREIRDRFTSDLPAFWEVRSFRVEATENAGTEVDPRFRSRFNAEVRPVEDLYRHVRSEDDVVFVSRVLERRASRSVYGRSESTRVDGTWNITFRLDSDPLANMGQPRGSFAAARVIEVNSPEEQVWRVEREERIEATWAAILSSTHRGTARRVGGQFPVVLHFRSYDAETGSFEGVIEWTSLNGARKAFRGNRIGSDGIAFREVGWDGPEERGALFGISYELSLDHDNRDLSGHYSHPQRRGTLRVDVN